MSRMRSELPPVMQLIGETAETNAIRTTLFDMADGGYRAFQCSLMPTVNPATVIGVRTPLLRQMAKDMAGTPAAAVLLEDLPHGYFEENQLHAFLIEAVKDFDEAVSALNAFLSYVDNWATCDQLSPKVFRGRLTDLKPHILRWLKADGDYTVRFGIGMLMRHGLGAADIRESLETVTAPTVLEREGYYVRMMVAWFFATALTADFDTVLPYLAERRLPVWTHGKTIQKACESNRISAPQKKLLRRLI